MYLIKTPEMFQPSVREPIKIIQQQLMRMSPIRREKRLAITVVFTIKSKGKLLMIEVNC